ncbi:uncharacterized protein TNCT_431051 [Trichonephila clavata]|uniref:Paired domain-containing protein n=1 Tax=Trichonephila clavata TaxID=2740835 RepID=A0A8X6KQA0_TRICU|nr:uncharacterized protein TNCT_431051 [Trichonephila clavata]
MSSPRETTESERLMVVKWSKEGKSLREIASLIGVTHGCVQKILQKYKKTGSVANIPGRGRKEILSTTAKRKIIHSVKKDPREETYETDKRNIVFKFPEPQSVGASERQCMQLPFGISFLNFNVE